MTPIIDMALDIMADMLNANYVRIKWLNALYPVLSCLMDTVDRFASEG